MTAESSYIWFGTYPIRRHVVRRDLASSIGKQPEVAALDRATPGWLDSARRTR